MKANVIFSPSLADKLFFREKIVVVVDALRASSSIIAAVANGAKEIVPVDSIAFGMKAGATLFGGRTIRAGEKNMRKIDGFQIGNSPREYVEEAVKGKSIIFLSTNGSKAIVKTKFSDRTLIGSFANLGAVADEIVERGKDFEVLCSGSSGGFSLEDAVCAGMIVQAVAKRRKNETLETTDAARAATMLANGTGEDVEKTLRESEHGKRLIENGFEEDVAWCAKVDRTDVVPVFLNTVIRNPNSAAASA
jgi:2-phosphosulfolactate phosphatase